MEFEIIIYICVIIFLLYRSWLVPGTSIIRKTVIFILCVHLFLYFFRDKFKSADDEPAHCKFMKELLDEDLLNNINAQTVGENISREATKIHENLTKITEKAYACNCESSSEYMKDGKSLKEIYSSRCDNKCKQMERPLTKCNSSDDCDFPFECFKYRDGGFEPHDSQSELGVCILGGSTHHLTNMIQMYESLPTDESTHGNNINSYLENDTALPFCHQPGTILKRVVDYNEDSRHYVEGDGSSGHYCCLANSQSDNQTDGILAFGSNLWDENQGAILSRITLSLLTNLGMMGLKIEKALQEARALSSEIASAREIAMAALEAEGIVAEEFVVGSKTAAESAARAESLIDLGRSIEYKWEPISVALRWTIFGGRGAGVVGIKWPGIYKVLTLVFTKFKVAFVAKGLAGVAANILKSAGAEGGLAFTRAVGERAANAGSRVGEAITSVSGRFTGAVVGAEQAALEAGGGRMVAAKGAGLIFRGARALVTGPVGAALMAVQIAGAVLDHYDVGGYQNQVLNKELMSLFDTYIGAYIEGMKTITEKEPPYAVDIVQTFFDKTGEHLVWPFNRCTESGEEGCNVEYIKNNYDKKAAKAMTIIVTALKQAEADEIHDKMTKLMKDMTENIKNTQTYMNFLDGYKTALDSSGNGDTEEEKTSNFLNDWIMDMMETSYTAEEAIERDMKYCDAITRNLSEDDYKYLGWKKAGDNKVYDYSELIGSEQQKLSDNDKDSPLVYFNKLFSPNCDPLNPLDNKLGCGIQLTKRGVKLYNRYRNLKADPAQEYIAFSKKYLLINSEKTEIIPDTDPVQKKYSLYQADCHTALGIRENDYPGLAQGTMLNQLEHICKYGVKWGKEGSGIDTTQGGSGGGNAIRDSWIYMKNGSPDTTNQPFSASGDPANPCLWGCLEVHVDSENERESPHTQQNLDDSSKNYSSRMMAYNYNIYMRESTSSSRGDPGFEDPNNAINNQDPRDDYSKWREGGYTDGAVDDWKEWRATALVAYLMDPSDAIDDDNYSCRIGGRQERDDDGNEQSSDKSSYCHRMTGNDGNLVTGFHWGGLGTYSTDWNAPKDRVWGDPVSSGTSKTRNYNDCVKSLAQDWAENVFGTSVVVSVRRIFDWF
tara:strand:+ start:243 stop:3587 length:3345 start_codon:yes stop_codon:yes gene_type:complete